MRKNPTTFQTICSEFYRAFVRDTRADGSAYYKLQDDCPDWMRTAVIDAHNVLDVPPLDWVYEHCRSIVGSLEDHDDPDADDLVHEIADGLVDTYTSARTSWIALRLEFASLVDEAESEGLISEGATFADRIGVAQYMALERMTGVLLVACKSAADDRDLKLEDDHECDDACTLDHDAMRDLGIK